MSGRTLGNSSCWRGSGGAPHRLRYKLLEALGTRLAFAPRYRNLKLISQSLTRTKVMLLAGFFASSIVVSRVPMQAAQGKERSGETQPAFTFTASPPTPTPATSPSVPAAAKSARAAMMYKRLWGVDNIEVREISSGILVRFSYRVVDANKAKVLNDKKATPYLIDETTGAALQVPVLEKVGQLRQTATPQNGRQYWMAFSNKGMFVKPGSRVDIVIGNFRINGLVVEFAQSRLSPQKP
jgi:hypothetical protein